MTEEILLLAALQTVVVRETVIEKQDSSAKTEARENSATALPASQKMEKAVVKENSATALPASQEMEKAVAKESSVTVLPASQEMAKAVAKESSVTVLPVSQEMAKAVAKENSATVLPVSQEKEMEKAAITVMKIQETSAAMQRENLNFVQMANLNQEANVPSILTVR